MRACSSSLLYHSVVNVGLIEFERFSREPGGFAETTILMGLLVSAVCTSARRLLAETGAS